MCYFGLEYIMVSISNFYRIYVDIEMRKIVADRLRKGGSERIYIDKKHVK